MRLMLDLLMGRKRNGGVDRKRPASSLTRDEGSGSPSGTNRRGSSAGSRIEALGLSTRAYNVLVAANITDITDLTCQKAEDHLAKRNCGRTTLNEIRSKLRAVGLSLADEKEKGAIDTPAPAGPPAIDVDKQPISILNLSTRPTNCLRRAGVKTVGQLRMMTDSELLQLRSLGTTSLVEIRNALAEFFPPETPEICEPEDVLDEIIASFIDSSGRSRVGG